MSRRRRPARERTGRAGRAGAARRNTPRETAPRPEVSARRRRPGFPERGLAFAVHAGLALVLLTPLVVTPWTLFPQTVGKALYARGLIAAAFVLWAVLARLPQLSAKTVVND